MAMFNASQTSLAGMLGAMAPPTTLRAYRSSTVARYNHPAPVRSLVLMGVLTIAHIYGNRLLYDWYCTQILTMAFCVARYQLSKYNSANLFLNTVVCHSRAVQDCDGLVPAPVIVAFRSAPLMYVRKHIDITNVRSYDFDIAAQHEDSR
jgi:hypothetical protein